MNCNFYYIFKYISKYYNISITFLLTFINNKKKYISCFLLYRI